MIPTSNHNEYGTQSFRPHVVYLLIPTSNHNKMLIESEGTYVVYLLIPTSNHNSRLGPIDVVKLYIFWFLHQTTTFDSDELAQDCCISFDSYIKPQLAESAKLLQMVVYLLIPTSNHNCCLSLSVCAIVVYLLIPTSNHNYYRSQEVLSSVVYLLIPTSNHNGFWYRLFM